MHTHTHTHTHTNTHTHTHTHARMHARTHAHQVLNNVTLRECATACSSMYPACQSFSRGAQPLSTCILHNSAGYNRCGGSLLPRVGWHMFYNESSCPSCTVGSMAPTSALPPPSAIRTFRLGAYDNVTQPSTAWRTSAGQRCAAPASAALFRLNNGTQRECEIMCDVFQNGTTPCGAVWFTPERFTPSYAVSACLGYGLASCTNLVGLPGGAVYYRPLPNETCNAFR
jgi:hypothetical protein